MPNKMQSFASGDNLGLRVSWYILSQTVDHTGLVLANITPLGFETYRFRQKRHKMTITPFNVIQGDRRWYRSKAYVRLHISEAYKLKPTS